MTDAASQWFVVTVTWEFTPGNEPDDPDPRNRVVDLLLKHEGVAGARIGAFHAAPGEACVYRFDVRAGGPEQACARASVPAVEVARDLNGDATLLSVICLTADEFAAYQDAN